MNRQTRKSTPRPALPRLAPPCCEALNQEPRVPSWTYFKLECVLQPYKPSKWPTSPPQTCFLGSGKRRGDGDSVHCGHFRAHKTYCVTVKENHRYSKLTSEFCNRNIIRVCMENLSIVIQGIKIEIKIYQTSYLVCLSCLWYVLSISDRFSAILASFSSTVQRKQL